MEGLVSDGGVNSSLRCPSVGHCALRAPVRSCRAARAVALAAEPSGSGSGRRRRMTASTEAGPETSTQSGFLPGPALPMTRAVSPAGTAVARMSQAAPPAGLQSSKVAPSQMPPASSPSASSSTLTASGGRARERSGGRTRERGARAGGTRASGQVARIVSVRTSENSFARAFCPRGARRTTQPARPHTRGTTRAASFATSRRGSAARKRGKRKCNGSRSGTRAAGGPASFLCTGTLPPISGARRRPRAPTPRSTGAPPSPRASSLRPPT